MAAEQFAGPDGVVLEAVSYEGAENVDEKVGTITYFVPAGPGVEYDGNEADASAHAVAVRWQFDDGDEWYSPKFPEWLHKQLLRENVVAEAIARAKGRVVHALVATLDAQNKGAADDLQMAALLRSAADVYEARAAQEQE